MTLQYEDLTDPKSLKMIEDCKGSMPAADIRLTETGYVLPKSFLLYWERLRDFEVREDDTWVISFPKCGTTWTQEMVWLLKNNLDYDAAKQEIFIRFPFLDLKFLSGEEMPDVPEPISILNKTPSPRFIKTHLPAELLPKQIWIKKPKIVYVVRDPRDAATSYFHHFTIFNNYKGTKDEFIEAFLADKVVSSPYWLNVLSYWKIKNQPNILFNTYEEMKKDLKSVLRRTAKFLEVNISDSEENKLLDHLSFDSMKKNDAVNYESVIDKTVKTKFIREGKSGAWRKSLSEQQVGQFDKWIKEWCAGTDCDLYR